jgi:hypothetical protein
VVPTHAADGTVASLAAFQRRYLVDLASCNYAGETITQRGLDLATFLLWCHQRRSPSRASPSRSWSAIAAICTSIAGPAAGR